MKMLNHSPLLHLANLKGLTILDHITQKRIFCKTSEWLKSTMDTYMFTHEHTNAIN